MLLKSTTNCSCTYVSSDMFSWYDFCNFNTKGCLVIRITLDNQWMKDYVPQQQEYFENFMVDEILITRLKPSHYLKCDSVYNHTIICTVILHVTPNRLFYITCYTAYMIYITFDFTKCIKGGSKLLNTAQI